MPFGLAAEDDGGAEETNKADKRRRISDQEVLRLEEERGARRLYCGDGHHRPEDDEADDPDDGNSPKLPVQCDVSACPQPGLRKRDEHPPHEDDGVGVDNQRRAETRAAESELNHEAGQQDHGHHGDHVAEETAIACGWNVDCCVCHNPHQFICGSTTAQARLGAPRSSPQDHTANANMRQTLATVQASLR